MKRERTLSVVGFLMGGVILICGLLNATPTEAATFYVATTGHNSNPGTETQPFLTINKGVGVLNPGDTLYIKSGTYKEWLDWNSNLPVGTSWSVPVTVKAFPGDTVTLLPNIGSDFVIRFIGVQYIILDGLILDGSNVTSDTVKITYSSSRPSAHHIRIQNSEIRNANKQGILTDPILDGSTSGFNEFINLDVHDNGTTDFHHGLYIKSANNLIRDSRIYQNAGWGVHVYNSTVPGEASNNLVLKNKIYNNARVGDRGFGIILGSGNGNKAYNNLIWGNKGGIQVAYNVSSNNEVYNNTIYANKGSSGYYCIYVGASKDDRVKNNICWENGIDDISDNGTNTVLAGNSTTNPLFVNAAGLDFQLQEGSPGVDGGLAVNGVLDDFDGTSRPQGSKYDLGAYEYISGGADTDPPATPTNVLVH